jgi:hypothetical protein
VMLATSTTNRNRRRSTRSKRMEVFMRSSRLRLYLRHLSTARPGNGCSASLEPFSGCHHCEWAWLGCTVIEDGAQQIDVNGVPETRQCFLRLSQCEILDTWYTTGLCGTGSNDLEQQGPHFTPPSHGPMSSVAGMRRSG